MPEKKLLGKQLNVVETMGFQHPLKYFLHIYFAAAG